MCKGILKTIIPIFAIIIGILSIGIIVIGARLKSNKPVFWDYVGDDYNQYYDTGCWVVIIFGSVLLVCCIFGIIGACKRSKCALCIYSIGIIILCLCFLFSGIAMVIFFNPFFSNLQQDNCTSTKTSLQFLKYADELFTGAQANVYCKAYSGTVTGQCSCNIDANVQLQYTSSTTPPFGANFFTKNNILTTGLVTELQQCPDLMNALNAFNPQGANWYTEYLPLGQYLENKFSCSGICTPLFFYMFSGINKGIPANNNYNGYDVATNTGGQGCKVQIENFVAKYKDWVYFGCFIAAGFLFLNILFNICLCTIKRQKKQQGGRGVGGYLRMDDIYNESD